MRRSTPLLLLCLLLAASTPAGEEIKVVVERQKPCNLFEAGAPVQLTATAVLPFPGKVASRLTVVDYFRKQVIEREQTLEAEKGQCPLPLDLGQLPNGYYEATLSLVLTGENGRTASGSRTACLGVAPSVSRTAREAREGGYRIGIKMWYENKAWWRGNLDWDEREAVAAMTRLGMQWTRAGMTWKSGISTPDLIREFPVNVVMKVESFPEEVFDVARYGTLEEWKKANGGGWNKKTVPMKEPYQAWLREELKDIPPEQNVFEIWNEAWDKMSAQDLATISNYVAEVILAERPDAIIGPNLRGSVSPLEYDAAFIKAGGMKGMKMVALHPYSGYFDRTEYREYQKWLQEQTGRPIDIYITEYGTHSCPEGPSKNSEEWQAQKVARFTLGLYAEGAKAILPHCLGQREENRTYHEDWFGFIRLDHEPKPVFFAQATCARMVDGSRYVGDLWLGEGVDAMLFEREGQHVLALVTREETKEVELPCTAESVTLTTIMGAEQTLHPEGGKLSLKVGPDVVYVSGLPAELAKSASMELDPRRWPEPAAEEFKRNTRVARRFQTAPVMDGDLAEWNDMTQFGLINPKVNGNDASGVGYLAWDENYLYLAVNMRDDQIYNTKHRPKLYQEDSIELFVSTKPRDEFEGHGEHDFQFFIAPTSAEGKAIVGFAADREAGLVTDVEGAKYYVDKTKIGWVAEVALPWSAFPGGFDAKPGARAAIEVRVNDADASHKRWKIDPEDSGYVQTEQPARWSLVTLEN